MNLTGEIIKEWRTKKGYTQTQLALKLGVSRKTIVNYETGKEIPETKRDIIEKLFRETTKEENQESTPTMHYSTGIPYYPDVNVSAGLDFITHPSSNPLMTISIPNLKADAFINVFGDSMYPKYCSGEIIGIKSVEKEMVMFGHAYVVEMSDGEAYLKYIKKGSDSEHWLLASENQNYEPREFHLNFIKKVYIIKAVISKTTLF